MKKLIFTFFTLLLLASCTSFPVNETSEDALLLIPVFLDKQNPGNVFGNAQVTISDENGNEAAKLILVNSSDFKYVQLPPGSYKVSRSVFVFDSTNKRQNDKEINIPFELKAGKITVLPQYMYYGFKTEIHKPNTYFMHYGFYDMEEFIIDNLKDQLQETPEANTWDIIYPEI